METSRTGLTHYRPDEDVESDSEEEDENEQERQQEMKELLVNAFDDSDSSCIPSINQQKEHGEDDDEMDEDEKEEELEREQEKEVLYRGAFNDSSDLEDMQQTSYNNRDRSDHNQVEYQIKGFNNENCFPNRDPVGGNHHFLMDDKMHNQYNFNAINQDNLSSRSGESPSITSNHQLDNENYNIKLPLEEIHSNSVDINTHKYNKSNYVGYLVDENKENMISFDDQDTSVASGGLQSKFMDSNTNKQLQLLYDARGKELDQLSTELEKLRITKLQETKRFQHEMTLLKAQNDTLEISRSQYEILLTEKDAKMRNMQADYEETYKKLNEANSLVKTMKVKMETSESTIQMLEQNLCELKTADAWTKSRQNHEDFLGKLRVNHNEQIKYLESKLTASKSNENDLSDKLLQLKNEKEETDRSYKCLFREKSDIINELQSSLEARQLQCKVLLSSSGNSLEDKIDVLVTENNTLKNELASLEKKFREREEDLEFYDNALKLQVLSQVKTSDDSIVDLKLTGQKKLTYDDTLVDNDKVKNRKQDSLSNSTDEVTDLRNELQRALGVIKHRRDSSNDLKEELRRCTIENRKCKAQIKSLGYDVEELNLQNGILIKAESGAQIKLSSVIKENYLFKKKVKSISEYAENLQTFNDDLCYIIKTSKSHLLEDFVKSLRLTIDQHNETLKIHKNVSDTMSIDLTSNNLINLLENQLWTEKLNSVISILTKTSLKITPLSIQEGSLREICSEFETICMQFKNYARLLINEYKLMKGMHAESQTKPNEHLPDVEKSDDELPNNIDKVNNAELLEMKQQFEVNIDTLKTELHNIKLNYLEVCKENAELTEQLTNASSFKNDAHEQKLSALQTLYKNKIDDLTQKVEENMRVKRNLKEEETQTDYVDSNFSTLPPRNKVSIIMIKSLEAIKERIISLVNNISQGESVRYNVCKNDLRSVEITIDSLLREINEICTVKDSNIVDDITFQTVESYRTIFRTLNEKISSLQKEMMLIKCEKAELESQIDKKAEDGLDSHKEYQQNVSTLKEKLIIAESENEKIVSKLFDEIQAKESELNELLSKRTSDETLFKNTLMDLNTDKKNLKKQIEILQTEVKLAKTVASEKKSKMVDKFKILQNHCEKMKLKYKEKMAAVNKLNSEDRANLLKDFGEWLATCRKIYTDYVEFALKTIGGHDCSSKEPKESLVMTVEILNKIKEKVSLLEIDMRDEKTLK